MKYSPGSFSKNFAWHGTGLRRLHEVIRKGYGGLTAVKRDAWRKNSGIKDASLELIPINFFLHNKSNHLSVDELVFQAITKSHSLAFDRLALFAFHLNRVGDRPTEIPGRPAMWANDFVRNQLWQSGAWRTAELEASALKASISSRMNATAPAQTKCSTNYRHLFELCAYLPSKLPVINPGAESWLGQALFLTWDRMILDGGEKNEKKMIAHVKSEEIHKLLGLPEEFLFGQVERLAISYLSAGDISRFSPSLIPTIVAEIPEEASIDWLSQQESDEPVQRREIEVQALARDRRKAAALKQRYDNTCMFCGKKLAIDVDRFYSEAAHIRALGQPHNGPDRIGNMIILCPNHHMQFDQGLLRLKETSGGFVVTSKLKSDPLEGVTLKLKHSIDKTCVDWHSKWFDKKR